MSCIEQGEEALQLESDGGNDAAISDDEIPEGIDLNDPYFQEEYKQLETTPSEKHKKNKKRKGKKSRSGLESDGVESKQEQVGYLCVVSVAFLWENPVAIDWLSFFFFFLAACAVILLSFSNLFTLKHPLCY